MTLVQVLIITNLVYRSFTSKQTQDFTGIFTALNHVMGKPRSDDSYFDFSRINTNSIETRRDNDQVHPLSSAGLSLSIPKQGGEYLSLISTAELKTSIPTDVNS